MGKRKDFVADKNTSVEKMFSKVSLVEFQDLVPGSCRSIGEVYEKIVRPNELPKDIVLDWWEFLKRYMKESNCVYFIRKFEHKVRRGFYTRDLSGAGFAYCGNPFAEYFLAMAKAGFNPMNDYDAFKDFLNPTSVSHIGHGYRQEGSKGESPEHQAYTLGPNTKLSRRGWYLAHIFSVAGDDFRNEEEQRTTDEELLTCGQLEDWHLHENLQCPYRDIGRNISDVERLSLCARFLRFVNPMNFFLVPKKLGKGRKKTQRLLAGGMERTEGIGEYKMMTAYMREIRRRQYGRYFDEFEEMALSNSPVGAQVDMDSTGAMEIDLKYWR